MQDSPTPNPLEGQYFQLKAVQQPPKPQQSWGVPLAIGALAIPLLMLGFGFSQQQPKPDPSPSPTAFPSAAASPEASPSLSPIASNAAANPVASQPQAVSPQQPAVMPQADTDASPQAIARIHAPGKAANFRTAPSLHSQVQGILRDGDLVELQPESRVLQDGVTWVPVTFRGRSGWVAANFVGGNTNGL